MIALQTTWDPSSTGIDLFGKFTIHYYSLMWMVAFILGWYIMKRIYLKENLSEEKLDSLFIYTILGTMIGARLGHVIFYQFELFEQDFFSVFLPFKFNPTFEFTGFRGLASHGATIGVITSMYLYNNKILHKSVILFNLKYSNLPFTFFNILISCKVSLNGIPRIVAVEKIANKLYALNFPDKFDQNSLSLIFNNIPSKEDSKILIL